MKYRYRSFCVAMIGMGAALVVSACNNTSTDSGAQRPDEPKVAASEPTIVADNVATVNGVGITRTALNMEMGRLQGGGNKVTAQQALNEMVDVEVLRQEAERRGLDKRPQIAAEIARQRAVVLSTNLLREVLASNPISDDDLRREYAVETAALPDKEYHLEHILVATEQDAKEVLAALSEGKTFAAMARERSKDNSASDGGDIGWQSSDRLIPALANAVGGLREGEVSAPIKSDFGWHLLRLVKVRAVDKPEFEKVRARLVRAVSMQRAKGFIRDLRSQASIELGATQSGATAAAVTADDKPAPVEQSK